MPTAAPALPPVPAGAGPGQAVRALRLVVMGVSGCGKSSIGRQLALALGLDFIEGDDLHPPHNVALMAAGTPLTDADRADWLAGIATRLGAAHSAGCGLVVACSALKRSYRDLLRARCPGLRFIHLHGTPDQLRQRLKARTGHYMPPSLLDSQLATLEPPDADEAAMAFDITRPTHQVAATVLACLQQTTP